MKETVQRIGATLSSMSPQRYPYSRTGMTPVQTPSKLTGSLGPLSGQPGLEPLLEDIASRLSSIENMYTNMTHRLVRNEGTIRDLQHISAGAISETARLVEIVNTGGTPLASSRTPVAAAGNVTPPPMRSGGRQLEHLHSAQPASITLQQHSSQIHKLVAGLDFLEQHIIRQDQVIEGVQKQLVMVSAELTACLNTSFLTICDQIDLLFAQVAREHTGLHSPSELSIKIHDLGELVNKLRSHMYKVEKKAAGSEAYVQEVQGHVSQLTAKVEALEQACIEGSGARSNPLFSSPDVSKNTTHQQNLSLCVTKMVLVVNSASTITATTKIITTACCKM